MSRTPRRPRHLGRHAPPAVRAPSVTRGADPGAGLRALIEEGIIAAAALDARDDLELAAASTQRLGALSSGMWRALSRELATAAERLDRSAIERVSEIDRHARSLQVDPAEVIAVGAAAAHLAEHRERLETLVKPGQDAHHLLGPDMLFGFSLEAAAEQEEDEDEDDVDVDAKPVAVDIALFLWPTPLTPAIVSIAPALLAGATATALTAKDVSLELGLNASPLLFDALIRATGLSSEASTQALMALGVACWTAHHLDELPPDDDEDDEGEGEEEDTQV